MTANQAASHDAATAAHTAIHGRASDPQTNSGRYAKNEVPTRTKTSIRLVRYSVLSTIPSALDSRIPVSPATTNLSQPIYYGTSPDGPEPR